MNKCLIIIVLGVVSVVLTETAGTSDRQKLYKALKQKFKELKITKMALSDKTKISPAHHDEVPVKTKNTPLQHQHDKAASAIGLALLDIHKSKNVKVQSISNKSKDVKKIDDRDDDFSDNDQDEDDDDDKIKTVVVPKKSKHQKLTGKETKEKKLKMDIGKWNHKKQQNGDIENESGDDESEDDGSAASGDNSKQDEPEEEKEEKIIKNSDNSLKNSVKSLKYSVKHLRDKDLQTVNVGELKHLLATSVENLDKAEEAIHDLLQYDADKKSTNKNNKPAAPGYPQPYGGYPQIPPSNAYQTTCPGQCSSLCAPACQDPCCRVPPNGNNMGSPPMQARGSYQQGLVNAYPPLTTLSPGVRQGGPSQFQQQGLGQQCGSQCSPQSCAQSCNPSCCASGAQATPGMQQQPNIIPLSQHNAGCPTSCFSNCDMDCPRRCCVPGRK